MSADACDRVPVQSCKVSPEPDPLPFRCRVGHGYTADVPRAYSCPLFVG